MVNEPFCSFCSGHFTMAWAGMLYLTLFLCFKFAIVISFCYQTASS
jgi:membrane-associated phospholipid phosphatase